MKERNEAFRLFNQFYIHYGMTKKNCKQCAIFVVDEKIKSHEEWATEQIEVIDFLNKVKIEIEKI